MFIRKKACSHLIGNWKFITTIKPTGEKSARWWNPPPALKNSGWNCCKSGFIRRSENFSQSYSQQFGNVPVVFLCDFLQRLRMLVPGIIHPVRKFTRQQVIQIQQGKFVDVT